MGIVFVGIVLALAAEVQMRRVDPPAPEQSGMAFLAKGAAGEVYLSWVEPVTGGGHALRYSRWNGSAWEVAETVAAGNNWFVNWADFPALAVHPDGSLYAHWLGRPEKAGKWGYGIHVARRDPKSGKWKETAGLGIDNKEDYAGFLSFVTQGPVTGAIYLSPPPGAAASAGHSHGGEEEHRKTVRFVAFRGDGSILSDREIDSDACSCCQTSIAVTEKGLLAAYRDHRAGEIRDISVIRFADGAWTEPRTLHADGWNINGCPTEGPSIAAVRNHAAVAWLTRAGGVSKVQLAMSADGGATFSKPVRIDDGNPLGRPAATMLDERNYLVAWIEKTVEGKGEVRVRRVSREGRVFGSTTVARVAAARSTGLPKVIVAGEQVLVAWRDDRVRVSVLSKEMLLTASSK